ncbi:MAG: DUF5674 family protein [Nitrospirales bacterium]|nr:DUF5674 family protein [Nitrospirales bacterium]
MRIITETLSINDLKKMAADMFGDIVKAVTDIDRELIAVDAELHSDLEARLLEDGSQQKHLWGINLYPEASGDEFIEFDSMINVRPSQDNRSRGVESEAIRVKIIQIVGKRIER